MTKLEVLGRFFRGRSDAYLVWEKGRDHYRKVDEPLTEEVLKKHLRGEIAVAVYVISEDNRCWFGVYDWDEKGVAEKVITLKRTLEHFELPALIEPTGGRGVHLWTFFDGVSSEKVYKLLHILREKAAESLELAPEELVREVFPKQPSIPPGGFGNAVKLPWGVHPRTGKRSNFVDESGNKLDESIFDSVVPASEEKVDEILAEFEPEEELPELEPEKPPEEEKKIVFTTVCPCVNRFLSEGCFPDVNRNEAILRYGIHLKKQGWSREEVERRIREANETLTHGVPMKEHEIKNIIKSIFDRKGGKGYEGLGCDKDLWAGFYCGDEEKKRCPVWRAQQQEKKEADIRIVTWLKSKESSRFIVSVNGTELSHVFTAAELLSKNTVQRIIFAECGFVPELPKEWKNYINEQMASVQVEEASREVTDTYMIERYIKKILREAHEAETLEELNRCYVHRSEDFIYFRPSALLEKLKSRFGVKLTPTVLWSVYLRRWGATMTTIRLGEEASVKVCKLPLEVVEEE